MFNLLYSLPEYLQNHVFCFDPTFANTFKQDDFKFELCIKQMFKFDREKYKDVVLQQLFMYFDSLNFDGSRYWCNDFGFFDFNHNETSIEYLTQYNLVDFIKDNYELSFFEDGDIIKFKILPIASSEKKNQFLDYSYSQERTFDGFICSIQNHKLIESGAIENPVPYSAPAVWDFDLHNFDVALWVK